MKIAIVNDIHVGRALEHGGCVRASSHLVEGRLQGFLHHIQKQHAPDLLVNLGDLIRSESRESDLQSYRRQIALFKQLHMPVLHLLGNHELKAMSCTEIEAIWQEAGFFQKSYGCKAFGAFTVVWLGLEARAENPKVRFLPEEQLTWLTEHFKHNHQPTLLFTHCPIDDHNVSGNFFYEATDQRNALALFLDNHADIRRALAQSPSVVAVLQAHLHDFHVKQIDHVSYVTCPAMGDNICAPEAQDNVPDIYTLLTLDSHASRFTVKAFSGHYCFAGYEGTWAKRS